MQRVFPFVRLSRRFVSGLGQPFSLYDPLLEKPEKTIEPGGNEREQSDDVPIFFYEQLRREKKAAVFKAAKLRAELEAVKATEASLQEQQQVDSVMVGRLEEWRNLEAMLHKEREQAADMLRKERQAIDAYIFKERQATDALLFKERRSVDGIVRNQIQAMGAAAGGISEVRVQRHCHQAVHVKPNLDSVELYKRMTESGVKSNETSAHLDTCSIAKIKLALVPVVQHVLLDAFFKDAASHPLLCKLAKAHHYKSTRSRTMRDICEKLRMHWDEVGGSFLPCYHDDFPFQSGQISAPVSLYSNLLEEVSSLKCKVIFSHVNNPQHNEFLAAVAHKYNWQFVMASNLSYVECLLAPVLQHCLLEKFVVDAVPHLLEFCKLSPQQEIDLKAKNKSIYSVACLMNRHWDMIHAKLLPGGVHSPFQQKLVQFYNRGSYPILYKDLSQIILSHTFRTIFCSKTADLKVKHFLTAVANKYTWCYEEV